MKFLLFRILLLHRTRDQGFTLPMVIGIGLIMVLLGSMSLVQSSEENLTSISKDKSSTSLAMAELGIARYRELLNNNRVLAVYSLDGAQGWKTTNVSDQTCDVISSAAGGWADTNDLTGWRDITLDETVYGVDFNDDGDQTDTTVEIGSYKLVDYIYDNDDDTNPAVDDIDTDEDGIFDQTSDAANTDNPNGILTVQGRKNDDGGVAQIQVSIPIGVNTDDLVTLDPGIWIHQGNESGINFGTLNFTEGNLVLYKNASGCDEVTVIGGITAIRDPRDLPPLATLPTTNNTLESDGVANDISGDSRYDTVDNELILGTLVDAEDSGADPIDDIDDRYFYEVTTNLGIEDGQSLITDGNAKVVVIVNGDLNIDGNVNMTNSSDDATSRYLEIHVTGNVNISGSGTVNIKGLIHTPNGTVNITGSPTVNVTGSIWANDWDSVGTVNVESDDYQFYSVTTQRTPNPLTYAPTGWQTQEAD